MNPIEEALKIKEQIIAWRRDFHMYPELKYEEERTSKIVEGHLHGWGYRVKRVGTGIIADIGEGEKTIALRADMDAFRSRRKTTFRTSPESPERCTPAATTPTRRCSSVRER
jgi:metal-dependent amidase/aminoacylase/carboxypeptidase family protein